jgi:hypothetical protein
MLKPDTLVRYHGSNDLYRGYALKVVGLCDCPRCLGWDADRGCVVRKRERCQLADPFIPVPAMRCVRPWHVTEISQQEAEAEPCITVEEAYDNHA